MEKDHPGAFGFVELQKDAAGRLRLLESVVTHAQDAILITEADPCTGTGQRIVYVNDAFCRMTGYAPEEVQGKSPRILQGPGSDQKAIERIRKAVQKGRSVQTEVLNYRKDGAKFWMSTNIVPVATEGGRITHWIAIERDITSEKRQRQELEVQKAELEAANRQLAAAYAQLTEINAYLETQAATDGLTGLTNHRIFQERLIEEVARSHRYRLPLSLILLDVDNFKQYNDTYGHPAGDTVLKSVAALMRQHARKADVTARYGGEEFAVILPHTDAEGGLEVAEKIRRAIACAEWPHRDVTASFGVSTLPMEAGEAAALLAKADGALYASKQHGRNRVTHSKDVQPIAFPLSQYTDLIQSVLSEYAGSLMPIAEQIRESLVEGYDAAIEGLSRVLDMRDHETEGHSVRVTTLMVQAARAVGFTEEEIRWARWGALLHDIGKMGVPDEILYKREALNEEEWEIMRRHPTIAYEMLERIDFLRPTLDIPYCHHEKWDGTGYPRGLKGDEIPVSARIFAVIDVWDALTSDRPYRKAWRSDQALYHIKSLAGTHFDARAVRIVLQVLGEPFEIGEPVVGG